MYTTKNVTKAQLQSIFIKDQKQIVRLTKNELSPLVIWEVIKQESQNFTVSNSKAEEADKLLDYLLKNNTEQSIVNDKKSKNQTVEIEDKKTKKMSLKKRYELKKKRRARELMLLELETSTAA
ncbi:hypothetical protein [Kordia jejudonensis]|uniref:hypothetical protein n=1 Tax=Kordia jejudonensis TaxID=1348245 RepID=UPI00062932FB|nr:hypothetical protein [Kordia jejudonensis]